MFRKGRGFKNQQKFEKKRFKINAKLEWEKQCSKIAQIIDLGESWASFGRGLGGSWASFGRSWVLFGRSSGARALS